MTVDVNKKAADFAAGMNKRYAAARVKCVAACKASDEKKKKANAEGEKRGMCMKDGGPIPKTKPEDRVVKLNFVVATSKVTKKRTGKEQAKSVLSGKSWTCASNHMADKARHVNISSEIPKKGDKGGFDKKSYQDKPKSCFGDGPEFAWKWETFKSEWAAEMKKQGFKNYKGKDGYGEGDAYHLELPDSRPKRSDAEVIACMVEYATQTRVNGKKKNDQFEKSWAKDLKKHIEAAEKKADPKKEGPR
ncbi:hypothetical protein [Sulfitobacter geojensis]|uniref:hypothetical protein n=1 Tax=Sulfitobacter geojensis TaxID=1342299 RepID=UPI0007DA360A|nr:hypothetical protein [Sulfitobacter geojensis]OAN94405.1 hypothetical protein A8B74_02060 [Sulfitobacter geojensis]